jgi:ribonucleoside-diphosphate reductase alpha chain
MSDPSDQFDWVEYAQEVMKVSDLCPECGEAAVVNEEGCRKCYACGYSEC